MILYLLFFSYLFILCIFVVKKMNMAIAKEKKTTTQQQQQKQQKERKERKERKPKAAYCIGALTFRTKKECEQYARSIICRLGCGPISSTHDSFSFFYDLIQNHPKREEKIGSGIASFEIVPNPLIPKYFQTLIHRTDGSTIDFSWVHCCQFKPRTAMDDLVRCMRASIRDTVIQFKRKQRRMECAYCECTDKPYEEYHVDHDQPSFHQLKEDFLQQTKQPFPTQFADCPATRLTIFRSQDQSFEIEWKTYHDTHCQLQILCRSCNLRKLKH